MALDPEEIASALDLDAETDREVVTLLKERIEARLGTLKLNPHQMSRAESSVMDELREWPINSAIERTAMPTSAEGWRDGVDQCLARAETRLADSFKLTATMEAENLEAFYEQKDRHGKEAARMDDEAEELGLPAVEGFSDEREPRIVNSAGMDEVAVARLGVNDAVATTALSSCTGVSLFDPETKVGAIMHVYQGKVTIDHAVEAMQLMDPRIEPGNLQVTLMPGVADGANTSHLENLRDQLSKAGITKVRDFSKEGRTSADLLVRGDGVVIAGVKTGELGVKEGGPEVETRPRRASVGEVLGMGKHSPTPKAEGHGTDGPSTGSKLKRSNSEPDLRGHRRL